ncbi:MAG: DUF4411 family protein [Chloroherpetonaceae bacterium]
MSISKLLKYAMDSNVLISASRLHYPFDFAMPFWNGLLQYAEQGFICSIDKVQDELVQGTDELAKWAKKTFSPYFLETDTAEIFANYQIIINWARIQTQYEQHAKDEFYKLDNADPWLISFAYTHKLTIVTHEVFDPYIKRKIPIPNVCRDFGIQYIDLYQMLRDLKFHF